MSNYTLSVQAKSDLLVAKNPSHYSDKYKSASLLRPDSLLVLQDDEYIVLSRPTTESKNGQNIWHEITNYGRMAVREFGSPAGSYLRLSTKKGFRLTDTLIEQLLSVNEDKRKSHLKRSQAVLEDFFDTTCGFMKDLINEYVELKNVVKPNDTELKAAREEIAALKKKYDEDIEYFQSRSNGTIKDLNIQLNAARDEIAVLKSELNQNTDELASLKTQNVKDVENVLSLGSETVKATRDEVAALETRVENETLSRLRAEHQREMNEFKCAAMDIIVKLA